MEFIETNADQLKVKKPEKVVDKNSPEFLQERAERIEKRRARIAAKYTIEKGYGGTPGTETGTTPSSLDFLASIGTTVKTDRKGGQTVSQGQSQGSKAQSQGAATASTGSPMGEGGSGAGTKNAVEYSDPALDTQMEESRKQLEQIILDGETLITNVKIAAEYREKVRHDHADESKKERLNRLQTEAQESQEMYDDINQHWLASAEKLLPMELYDKIQEQKKSCDDLLEKQDEEIYNLRKELEDQDIEYENNLEMYQKDIMLMGDRIDDNVDTLRNAFMEELELIEEYTVQDREQLLEDNQKEWMNVLKEYEELEKNSLEARKNEALNKFDKLTDLYGTVKQEARILKNRMLTDMRTLFVEREKVKCAIQLNLEKLDYNLSVLRKREEENMRMKNSMKRLLLKLQDRFNAKSKELHDKVAKGKKQSDQLIKDIRRLESLCEDAKRKTLHMYAADYHNFMDLWALNETECREKLCRLLGSERYILEEQLGTGFFGPDMSKLDDRPKEVQCFVNKTSNSNNCCQPEQHADPFHITPKLIPKGSGFPGGFGRTLPRHESAIPASTVPSSAGGKDVGGGGGGEVIGKKSTGNNRVSAVGFKSDVMSSSSSSVSTSLEQQRIPKAAPGDAQPVSSRYKKTETKAGKILKRILSLKHEQKRPRKNRGFESDKSSQKGFFSEDSSKVTSMMSFLDMKVPDEALQLEAETSLLIDPATEFDFCPGPEPDPVIQRRLMRHITKVVCDQTGFLLEDKLRKIMVPLIDSERNLIHIDAVLQALGVDHINEMQILARYLLKYSSIMKGIVSKTSFREFSQDKMNVSAGGITDNEEELGDQCEQSSESEITKEINQLQEANRLTPSSSDSEYDDVERFDGDPRNLTPSAQELINKSVFAKVEGITEVHGLNTIMNKRRAQTATDSEEGVADGEGSTTSVVHIIEEFSSDESLANVLKQVEVYGEKIKDGTLNSVICPRADDHSSSSCSCESDPGAGGGVESESITSRCETDDALGSNKATVLSWVTDVAAGLIDGCRPRNALGGYEYGGEDESYIVEIVDGEEVGGRKLKTATTASTVLETVATSDPEARDGTKKKQGKRGKDKDKKKKSLTPAKKKHALSTSDETGTAMERGPEEETTDEELNAQEFERLTISANSGKSSCGMSDKSFFMSGVSIPTTGVDSTEFFYIEPNDVLRALAAFCRDHKSKAQSELPTRSQLCDRRIAGICFPSQLAIKEYWDTFLLLSDPKSKILWDGIMDVFNQYHTNLKVRNNYVEDIVNYYKQNYELSHLLKKHIMADAHMCSRAKVGPFNPSQVPYCRLPCSSNPQQQQRFNYPPCSRTGPQHRPSVTTNPIPTVLPDVEVNE